MTTVKGIRDRMAFFLLRRKLRSLTRQKSFVNLSDAHTVGILFQPEEGKIFEVVQAFLNKLKTEGKKVSAIGYINAKKIPHHFLLRKGYEFFCQEDLDWLNRPEPYFVNEFINTEFDMLINLSMENVFPVEYIFALSRAKCKAGKFFNESYHSDLSIDLKNRRDIEYLIQQLTHYLNTINSKQV